MDAGMKYSNRLR